jgi:uncharacterized protein (TIGR00369 family)
LTEEEDKQQFWEQFKAQGQAQPYYQLLGIEVEEISDQGSRLRLYLDPKLAQFHGFAHGGVAASLIDSAVGMAVGGTVGREVNVMTMEMKLNYFRPFPLGETVIASGRVINSSRRTVYGEAEVRDSKGKLLAKGAATYITVEHEIKTT